MAQGAGAGRLIGGRYRLVRPIGAGGFGRVWEARDETLQVDVAVKEVWLPPASSDEEHAERLARARHEARNAARLRDHPNIVGVHDVVIDEGVPWTVMQLVSGVSLQERLATGGPLPVDEAAHVARCLLLALQATHSAGIVHRDIKPANVLLTRSGEVLLADFGIAIHAADTKMTAPGTVIGSVEYMAPERFGAQGEELPRSNAEEALGDLFSLGATLYAAVEGVSPFARNNIPAMVAAVLHEFPAPPSHAGKLTALILGLLEKNPRNRPSINQAMNLLDHPPTSTFPAGTATAFTGGGVSSPGGSGTNIPSGGGTPIPAGASKSGPSRGAIVAVVAILVAAAIAIYYFTSKTDRSTPSASSTSSGSTTNLGSSGKLGSDTGDTTPPSTPPPSTPEPSPTPSPTPTPKWTDDGHLAEVGQCFNVAGTQSTPNLSRAYGCRPGSYEVVQRLTGTTDRSRCGGDRNHSNASVYYNDTGTSEDLLLCLNYKYKNEAGSAIVGDCVYDKPNLPWYILDYQTGAFKVIAKYYGTTSYSKCQNLGRYREGISYTATNPKLNVVLCMTYLYKDDAAYAKKNNCMKYVRQGSGAYLYFSDCNQANALVVGHTGKYNPSFCGRWGWVAYKHPRREWKHLDYTVCWRRYPS